MINRKQLEKWIPITKARKLVNEFINDPATYPDYDFYSRKRGINKDIPEEFYPLLLFAESLTSAASIRLSSDSLPGPDGAILLKDGSEITVQITVSHERNDGYKTRHSLRDTGTWFTGMQDTSKVIAERRERIIKAIEEKEKKFRKGTDMLLVFDDESIAWGEVLDPGLPNAVEEASVSLPPSKYSATYIIFKPNHETGEVRIIEISKNQEEADE